MFIERLYHLRFLFVFFSVILVFGALLFLGQDMARSKVKSASTSGVPFQTDKPIVSFASRKVCSLLGANQRSVGIYGQDGGVGTYLGGKSYFMFGDITGSGGIWIMPNSVSYTTDTDPSVCMNLTSKASGATATPMFPLLSTVGELTAWPVSWIDSTITSGYIYFYYVGVDFSGNPQGTGLAKMNVTDLSTQRIGTCTNPSNCYLWNNNTLYSTYGIKLMGAQTTISGSDIYIYVSVENTSQQIGIGLMKVPIASVAKNNIADYQYWNGSSFVSNISAVAPLWRAGSGLLWLNDVNPFTYIHGVSVRYNTFVGKWVATYNTGIVSVVAARTSDSLSGPWSSEQILVHCDQWVSGATGFFCYGGAQHEQFAKGPIIYETYSNGTDYQVYMQEIVLGSFIYQWRDSKGNTVYLQSSTSGPSGYTFEGNAFTASSVSASDLVPIYDWLDNSSGVHLYETSSPGGSYASQGIAFYAKNYQDTKNNLIAVYRWQVPTGGNVYSTFDLAPLGYTKSATPSFYAQGDTGTAQPPLPTATPTTGPTVTPSPTVTPIIGDPSGLTATTTCSGANPVVTFSFLDSSTFETGFWLDISRDPFGGPSSTSVRPSVWGVKGIYRTQKQMSDSGNPVLFKWDSETPTMTVGPMDSGDADSQTAGDQLMPQNGTTYFWRVKAFSFDKGSNHIYPPNSTGAPGQSITAATCP